MNRRSSLKFLGTAGAIAAVGGGYHWLTKDRTHAHLSVEQLLTRLDSLDLANLETSGTWEVSRTFNHLAQSVEFSMIGFPEMKSQLFRSTVGKLAFNVFQANGRMTHGLDEEIPGEVVNPGFNNSQLARVRLVTSLQQFEAFTQPLRPHFAYGELNKSQYALAHVMHVNNHLEEFRLA